MYSRQAGWTGRQLKQGIQPDWRASYRQLLYLFGILQHYSSYCLEYKDLVVSISVHHVVDYCSGLLPSFSHYITDEPWITAL